MLSDTTNGTKCFAKPTQNRTQLSKFEKISSKYLIKLNEILFV